MATDVESTLGADDYDEFGLLHENAEELGLPFAGRPDLSRRYADLPEGGRLSYLRWGRADPEIVFLHGGGQNAHTWDSVALVLGRPAVAFDLLGHGRSSWRDDRDYGPWSNAEALGAVLPAVAPAAAVVVGMSLGGATLIRLAATFAQLCRRIVIVDVTPQVTDPERLPKGADLGAVALISGPPTFDSFEEMAAGAVALSPNRPAAAVRRGVRHNARRLPDGRWGWRYDLFAPRAPAPGALPAGGEGRRDQSDLRPLWDDVSLICAPTLLVRGGDSRFVHDSDVAEFRRRVPSLRDTVVGGAGHAVQSDQPLELAGLIRSFAGLADAKDAAPVADGKVATSSEGFRGR
ncbi:alpha/beta hydrolase [Frankia sp. Ag45/Mut15]|uniref:Alpha/beta hydrolase n=1 Tax=Frankia umida TaxID=573489 RepID=A0ABT0K4M2_9ACTN|nr:alpha/beta hydrolase [Frankia umida]MCK9878746.1 alpha/beta hydrolase [Frankia umida]